MEECGQEEETGSTKVMRLKHTFVHGLEQLKLHYLLA